MSKRKPAFILITCYSLLPIIHGSTRYLTAPRFSPRVPKLDPHARPEQPAVELMGIHSILGALWSITCSGAGQAASRVLV